MNSSVFSIVFLISNAIVIIIVGIAIFSQMYADWKYKPEEEKDTIADTPKTQTQKRFILTKEEKERLKKEKEDNRLAEEREQQNIDIAKRKRDLEGHINRYRSTIAFATALIFYGLISDYYMEDVFQVLTEFAEKSYQTMLAVGISAVMLGMGSANIILNNLNPEKNHAHKTAFFHHTNNGIIIGFLSLIFFGLLFAFFSEYTAKTNVVKGTILSFILGAGLYITFRQDGRKSFLKKIIDFITKTKKENE